jgi:NADH:ubiquinone oxidoreductase subunit 2 (subunit N)
MNLLLRPLDNPADPVWSVIFMVILSVVGASYYIYYILRIAFAEMDEEVSQDDLTK